MARQTSTVISELALTIFCVSLGYFVSQENKVICAALLITAVASFFGMLRYGLKNPSSNILRMHKFTTQVAFSFTPAFFASVYVVDVHKLVSLGFFIAPMVVTFVLSEAMPENREVFMTVLSGSSVVAIIYVSSIKSIVSGIVGCCLLIFSSILVQNEGLIMDFKRVDIFHFVLIAALLFLTNGIIEIIPK